MKKQSDSISGNSIKFPIFGLVKQLKEFLDQTYLKYSTTDFIPHDPISIPHRFSRKQDIEIAGFFAAIFAWGNRKTIIQKCTELLQRMDMSPYEFVLHANEKDLRSMVGFKHRTFNDTDLLYCLHFFNHWYHQHDSLESAFLSKNFSKNTSIEHGLIQFRSHFFSLPDAPERTQKHVSSPLQHSACKRLNMYLRWMVRKDKTGIDFGIWRQIKPSQLVCPLDLHVQRVATHLGLLTRTQSDWRAAIELTNELKQLDPKDPVKYDIALFALGTHQTYTSYDSL